MTNFLDFVRITSALLYNCTKILVLDKVLHISPGKHLSQRQKTNLRTCAPSENSDQPAHSRSLIRIFTGRILNSKDAIFLHADNEVSNQTARMCRLI